MLLTVRETAFILGLYWKNVYYLLDTAQLDGVKVRDDWRVFSDSVEVLFDKRRDEELHRDGVSITDGLPGFEELIASIRFDRVQADRTGRYSGVQDRKGMEYLPGGCDFLPVEPEFSIIDDSLQFYFDFT